MSYDTNEIKTAYRNYLDHILSDYKSWHKRCAAVHTSPERPLTEASKKTRYDMVMKFAENLSFKMGKKYVKCFNKDGGVHSFIVNVHDDPKFQFGDILKPAGYGTPAKNFARGNIFTNLDRITWTGAS